MTAEKNSRLRMQKLISMLLIAFAVLLLAFKIYADSEPGALPLLLLLIGSSWYLINRYRLRSQSHIQ